MASFTVENYLKAIYGLSQKQRGGVSTNAIAEAIGTKAATVSDMLKKLSANKLIHYKKYQGTTLTTKGAAMALNIIRKHRLWEVFLVEKLDFRWDEVHDLAEELEHIDSDELINRLEAFLDNPKFDPHGDPIPDKSGVIHQREQVALTDIQVNEAGVVTGVKDSSKEFLQFLDTQGIELGDRLVIKEVFEYDKSRTIELDGKAMTLSHQVCKNLYVKTEA
ncbi:MAG: metal-dependent transcriptional regulator [Flavobacteriales bacterium]|nr:metal-dependent transcriptional regulator [Flavobacteriales bacterium]